MTGEQDSRGESRTALPANHPMLPGAMVTRIAGLRVVTVEPKGGESGSLTVSPVLFIHGMWDGSWIWSNYLDYFSSRGRRCHALDLQGRPGSKSVPNIGKGRFREYVHEAREVARALGTPVLVGHSSGGLIVQKLAEVLDPPAAVVVAPAVPRGVFAIASGELLAAALRHAPEILLGRQLMPGKAEITRLQLNNLPPGEQDRVYELHSRVRPPDVRRRRGRLSG